MSQPARPEKIRALYEYHLKIIASYRAGTLRGKVKALLVARARRIGLGIATYYRFRRRRRALIAD